MQAQSHYGRTVRCLSTAGGALNSGGELNVVWVMQHLMQHLMQHRS